MKVEEISLENYKRFETLNIVFAHRLNVIVGINGAGKSTILGAVAKMLSWYTRRLVSPTGIGSGFQINENDIRAGSPYTAIKIKVRNEGVLKTWTVVKNAKGTPISEQKSYLKELNEYVRDIRRDGNLTSVPVIVSYSVNRAVVSVPLRIRKHHEFSILNSYDDAFDNSADFRRFFEWFKEYDDIENERLVDAYSRGDTSYSPNNELKAVYKALSAFLPEFKNWKIRRTPLRMEVVKNDTRLNIDQLSDGEKCVIAMVGDLARRLVIANPRSEDPLSQSGIVLIDEIELHLHPEWQKSVLPRLVKTFPNIQFIVTTHSPLVVAQLNSLLYKNGKDKGGISIMALKDGKLSSLIDPETGLVMAGEMDEVIRSVDEEFDALLDGGEVE